MYKTQNMVHKTMQGKLSVENVDHMIHMKHNDSFFCVANMMTVHDRYMRVYPTR